MLALLERRHWKEESWAVIHSFNIYWESMLRHNKEKTLREPPQSAAVREHADTRLGQPEHRFFKLHFLINGKCMYMLQNSIGTNETLSKLVPMSLSYSSPKHPLIAVPLLFFQKESRYIQVCDFFFFLHKWYYSNNTVQNLDVFILLTCIIEHI